MLLHMRLHQHSKPPGPALHASPACYIACVCHNHYSQLLAAHLLALKLPEGQGRSLLRAALLGARALRQRQPCDDVDVCASHQAASRSLRTHTISCCTDTRCRAQLQGLTI